MNSKIIQCNTPTLNVSMSCPDPYPTAQKLVIDPLQKKRCSDCLEIKMLFEFDKNAKYVRKDGKPSRYDGHRNQCRPCMRVRRMLAAVIKAFKKSKNNLL
jgi:hypothetical protein